MLGKHQLKLIEVLAKEPFAPLVKLDTCYQPPNAKYKRWSGMKRLLKRGFVARLNRKPYLTMRGVRLADELEYEVDRLAWELARNGLRLGRNSARHGTAT